MILTFPPELLAWSAARGWTLHTLMRDDHSPRGLAHARTSIHFALGIGRAPCVAVPRLTLKKLLATDPVGPGGTLATATHVIDLIGAFIPGVGIPVVLVVATTAAERDGTHRLLVSTAPVGEQGQPKRWTDGAVWQALSTGWDTPGAGLTRTALVPASRPDLVLAALGVKEEDRG